jgi:hypothetical protein
LGTPRLSRKAAREAVRYVEKALADGYKLNGIPSAIEEAARRYTTEVDPKLSRGAFQTRVRVAKNLYGIKPKLPKNPPPVDSPTAPQIGGTPLHAKIVQLQDEVLRLTKELRQTHRENNTAEIIRNVVGTVTTAPRGTIHWLGDTTRPRGKPTPEVPIIGWADIHAGEVVEPSEVHGFNAYNMSIAEERFTRAVDKAIELAREHHTGFYPGFVANCVGDMVSGGLHPELLKTDEIESIPACIKVIDWIISAIERLKGIFGYVYVPMVCGNHGRTTAKPEFKRYYQKNWDYLIACMVQKHFHNDPKVLVEINPSNDVHYRVYNLRFLLVHGDMLGVKGGDGIIGAIGPIMRGEIKKAGQSAALGLEYDVCIMGHWHQELWLPRALVCNTLKGFDEYARNQLGAKPTRPSQPLFFVHPVHGITARWSIYVDKPGKPAADDWVSVFDRKAA